MVQFLQNPHANAVQEMLAEIEARKQREKQMRARYLLSLMAKQPYQRQMEILRSNPELARGISMPEYAPTDEEAASSAIARRQTSTVEGWQPDAFDSNYAAQTLVTGKVPNKEYTETTANRTYMEPVDFSRSLIAPTNKIEADTKKANADAAFTAGPHTTATLANANQSNASADKSRADVTLDRDKFKASQDPNNPTSPGFNKTGGTQQDALANLKSEATEVIKQLRTHPGFESAVGAKGIQQGFGLLEKPLPGTKTAGYSALVKRLQSLLTFPNISLMKGAGAISNIEFETLKSAATLISTDLEEKDFMAELNRVAPILERVGGGLMAPAEEAMPNDGTEWRKNPDGTYTRIK